MSSENPSIKSLLVRLWGHISPRRRAQLALLLVLMFIASFAEIVSIGAVLPFLGALTAPETLFAAPALQPVFRILGIAGPAELLLPLTIMFAVAAIVSGGVRLVLLWATTRLSFATGADLSISIYRRTLYQPYAVHVARNSSEVITGISNKANGIIYSAMMPLLVLLSSGIILIAILAALISVNPVIAFTAFGGFGTIYAMVTLLSRKRLRVDSQRIAGESTQVIKSLQEGLGGIRDVLIDGTQEAYCRIYRQADQPLRRAQGNITFIGQSPRYGMEALGMVLIAGLAFVMSRQPDGLSQAIPVLGALALGAQRLLPVLQQAYASWSGVQSGQASLEDALDLLDQPLPPHADEPLPEPIPFTQAISLSALSFRYASEAPLVLRDIDLTIPKGSRVGFIGTTGSGKSTLLDIVMGLLRPTAGGLRIDGEPIAEQNHRAWQAHIAHVPQSIFLADTSIEENIAFGLSPKEIDHERVRRAAEQAQIADIIESWPKQYRTFVGERGVRLSGGQRQRIGIARALYKQADVIIFDEATSALDNQTEAAVMQAIEELHEELTVLIIAHRLTTLRNCDMIVELENGRIVRQGTYDDVVASAEKVTVTHA
ncbi:ABC transporter ATP-binding protein [Chlorobium phaeovibrioides]|uniref:ABC transporter ATP-binding protein n=1 Tax=Chlorobium phaeovibrioides TaxID=1094 RepID=A0A432ASS4_CHLPH|nr:ABC transporter ATP-binding protein [Chlorobium phaeovibrioides]RTY36009.1 ABC transporter ATP-binding protein [Chlorobium phaeovibrioides]